MVVSAPEYRFPYYRNLGFLRQEYPESARANDLDAYEYLKYLLEEMPNNHYLEQPEILERYLPWSEELPECCRLKQRHKKCLKS